VRGLKPAPHGRDRQESAGTHTLPEVEARQRVWRGLHPDDSHAERPRLPWTGWSLSYARWRAWSSESETKSGSEGDARERMEDRLQPVRANEHSVTDFLCAW